MLCTTASPVLTKPLARGADIVMHSATKCLNGHSDLMAGALVESKALLKNEATEDEATDLSPDVLDVQGMSGRLA